MYNNFVAIYVFLSLHLFAFVELRSVHDFIIKSLGYAELSSLAKLPTLVGGVWRNHALSMHDHWVVVCYRLCFQQICVIVGILGF